MNINWSVYGNGVYSTTETGLPLFTNTYLEFVFNLIKYKLTQRPC